MQILPSPRAASGSWPLTWRRPARSSASRGLTRGRCACAAMRTERPKTSKRERAIAPSDRRQDNLIAPSHRLRSAHVRRNMRQPIAGKCSPVLHTHHNAHRHTCRPIGAHAPWCRQLRRSGRLNRSLSCRHPRRKLHQVRLRIVCAARHLLLQTTHYHF